MKVQSIFYILLGLFFLHGATPVYGQENLDIHEPDTVQIVRTQVLEAQQDRQNYILTLEIESGLYAGQVLELPYIQEHPGSSITILPGDKMLVQLESNKGSISNAYISSYIRDQKLLKLAAAFAIILIIIGGKKGFKSIMSLIISGIAIYFIMLPMFFQGYDPIITTIIISTVVSILSLIIISGRNTKTLAAIIGTTGGVMIAGVLAIIVGSAAQLTGLSDEEMQSLLFIPQQISYDYSGILFSGMIIGALGAVMDVGMSIASSIEEIKQANSSLGTMALFRAGMNVGRDIMGTMSNTLIFAYTGGAIPLMLVFMAYHTPLSRVVNLEMIATEIIRALTGSIGLIIAVPITSIAAGTLFGRYRSDYY
jgi:uncharacterized membrane protein